MNPIFKMSLSKRLCLRSHSLKRQSFSERICDDLCEEILQYLSLEDKLRLECVSKQFQRTVFVRQNELIICRSCSGCLQLKIDSLNVNSLDSLLKKCPNITSIRLLRFNKEWNKLYNQFIQLVTKYCHNLVEFNAPLTPISKTNFNEFHKKFGSKLKVLKSFEKMAEFNRMKSFSNLQDFHLKLQITEQLIHTISGLKFYDLKTIRVCSIDDKELLLNKLIYNFMSVRHLTLSFEENYEWVNRLLKSVSNLKQLIHLKVNAIIRFNGKEVCDSFKQMANNCQKLKSLNCCFDINWKNGSEVRRLLSSLKGFKQLKRLKLDFTSDESEEEITENFSFSLFREFSSLTHLSLDLKSDDNYADESFLKDIDIHLPNVQCLSISRPFDTTAESKTRIADILSRLSKLESLRIIVKNDESIQEFKEEIVQKCRKLKTVVHTE